MISDKIDIQFANQHFTLLKEKAVFWHEQNMLLLADVHAGKASHFRRNGIPLSSDYLMNDLHRIESLVSRFNQCKVSILGDLYHSSSNLEHQLTDDFLRNLDVPIELIVGNHDQHSLVNSTLTHRKAYSIGNILLSHEPQQSELFTIYGHLHPAYSMGGKGRQYLTLPSFYIGTKQLILPAFGSLNGGRMYANLAKKSQIVLISDEGLVSL